MYRESGSRESVTKLDQITRWCEYDPAVAANESVRNDGGVGGSGEDDPLASSVGRQDQERANDRSSGSKFPVDHEINSKLYLWRGAAWQLEVDAVVNTTNESLDVAHSSPGLHEAAGPALAEECATLGGCRTGEAKITGGYDLPARRVIHTVGPRYAFKYHTAAENALSHCYRSCLELLIEHGFKSIAFGCIYTEAKEYPREPAAHVAIRTVRRFLEKHKQKLLAVVFCTVSSFDAEIYRRLLPLYFPRDKKEEEIAREKLPSDVGDENGETVIDERKIRILPGVPAISPRRSPCVADPFRVSPKRDNDEGSLVDPTFIAMLRDPDSRRKEQMERAAQLNSAWRRWGGLIGLSAFGSPPLSVVEEEALHARYLARANAVNLSDVAEMKIVYRGGEDVEGHPVMVVCGAHFLLRCMELEKFVLYVVKEFEQVIQRPYAVVYFHSAASLGLKPDIMWMKRLHQILGWRHKQNLKVIYILHPTAGLKLAVMAMQFLESEVWRKVVYVDRLLDLFTAIPREQITIPDFVFQHDLEVNGARGLGNDAIPRHNARRFQGMQSTA
ncbi:hypothetical protein CBR_g6630 [Chara braunii]|uniref:Macro domain-containing protein n=1 Tax=Chara braunii TaxID=69332 RepID=A0A388KKC3_CHABU|nr:hypothetical protein CBR_g6630 [Chara braunii]|eukprot:GBG70502.1 hypothetical protein CBR_g6630 [Chara braunii]